MLQPLLPALDWPALIPGPAFLVFELRGKPGHKGRHRSRIIVPKGAWVRPQNGSSFIPAERVKMIFMTMYPDPATEAYEKVLAEAGALFMRGRPPSERPLALLVHSFREIPQSWSKKDRARAIAGNILPTPKPDWDNYGKITDALNGIAWKDDSQICDGRVIKRYSETPALRIEVREMIEPPLGVAGKK